MMSDGRLASPRATDDYVTVEDLDRVPVRIASSPLPTVFTLTRDALRNGRRGTPADWRAAALSRMRRRDVLALAPLADPRCSSWPDVLDHNDAPNETLGEALERVVAAPSDSLLEPLEGDPDVLPGTWWDETRRHPDRWQRSYAEALSRAWLGLEPLWRRSAGLIEREAERIEAAVDRGVPTSQIVVDVHTRASLDDAKVRLAPTANMQRRLAVSDRGVILSPMIATGRGGIISTTGGWFVGPPTPCPTHGVRSTTRRRRRPRWRRSWASSGPASCAGSSARSSPVSSPRPSACRPAAPPITCVRSRRPD